MWTKGGSLECLNTMGYSARPSPAAQIACLQKNYGLSAVLEAHEQGAISEKVKSKRVVHVAVDTEGNQPQDWEGALCPSLVQVGIVLQCPASGATEKICVLYAPRQHAQKDLDFLQGLVRGALVYVWCTPQCPELQYVSQLLQAALVIPQQPKRDGWLLGLDTACRLEGLGTTKAAVDYAGFDRRHGWDGRDLASLPRELRNYAVGDVILALVLLSASADYGARAAEARGKAAGCITNC